MKARTQHDKTHKRKDIYPSEIELQMVERLAKRYGLRTFSEVMLKALRVLDRVDRGNGMELYPNDHKVLKIQTTITD
jgi:hypothetical protein